MTSINAILKSLGSTLGLVLLGLGATNAQAQLSMTWHTIDAGGGTSSGATLTLTGTIGQPDGSGSPLAGATSSLIGGFWPAHTHGECPADFDGDGTVDFFDYDAFVACFEAVTCPPGKTADFDGDGAIDFFDYDAFVVAFETPC